MLLLSLLSACEPTAKEPEPAATAALTESGGRLRDADGREVLLRGVNARAEGLFDVSFDDGRAALEDIPPFTADDCRFISEDLGMNLLRLPINWSAIEPERDQYDDSYLLRVRELAAACALHGVYTLADLHQDAYSKEIGEDGAPLWAIQPPPEELLEGPLTDLADRRTSPQVLAAFGSLYTDDGLIADYAEMAARVAGALAGEPSIIGLELHNEPVPLGRLAELDAFHAEVAAAVRAAAPALPLWFEPDSFRNLTDAAPVTTPFPFENTVYTPHLYVDVFESSPGDADAIAASLAGMVAEAEAHGAALVPGEFGADPSTPEGQRYILDALEAMDAARTGYAFWVYEEWGQGQWGFYTSPDGTARGALRPDTADLLARPFPEAIDGDITAIRWDSGAGLLTVGIAGAGSGVHRISLPARHFSAADAACDGAPVDITLIAGRGELRCEGAEITVQAR